MSIPTAALEQFISDMQDLKPGDVITNLNCEQCKDSKVLVLDDEVNLSLKNEEVCISIDPQGPFRWDFDAQGIVDKNGVVDGHFAPGVKVRKGAGIKELALYRQLPSFKKLRLNLTDEDLERFFRDEPNVPMVIEALYDDLSLHPLEAVEACMNYVFARAEQPVSRRELMLLSVVIRLIADGMRLAEVNTDISAVRGEDLNDPSFVVGDDPASHIMQ